MPQRGRAGSCRDLSWLCGERERERAEREREAERKPIALWPEAPRLARCGHHQHRTVGGSVREDVLPVADEARNFEAQILVD